MNKQYKEFVMKLLTKQDKKPIDDSWIKSVTHITLSKDDADWIKSHKRLSKIETTFQNNTEMQLHLSI